MKKLVLLISACCFIDLSAQVAPNPKITSKPGVTDSAKGKHQAGAPNSVGTGQNKPKKKNKHKTTTQVEHKSPDQAKVDSIKQEKAKQKK